MVKLTTDRLIIRDPKQSDFAKWHALMSNPQNMYYLDDIMTDTLEESRQSLLAAIAEAKSPDRKKYFFSAELKETGDFIGSIGYTVEEITNSGKIAHAGYFFLPEFHGRGYATEAFRAVIRFAFEDDNVFRINTGCFSENKASERVMQKCNLTKNTDYKACTIHDGRKKDRVFYRILKEESLKNFTNNSEFWTALDKLVSESVIVIDRPKGSRHPKYRDFVYTLDYGYLKGTSSMDGGGIDVWVGSDPLKRVGSVMCIVDLVKRDSEIKVLIGCTEEENAVVYKTHNKTEFMKAVLLRRESLSNLT